MGRAVLLVLLLVSATAVVAAPVPKENDAARLARVYGTPYEFADPSHCAMDGERLRVFVGPGSRTLFHIRDARGRMLAARRLSTDYSPVGAPRVWREVTGDFTLTVRVSFAGDPDRARETDGLRAAGLVAWAESNNFLVLARTGRHGVHLSYTHPEGVRVGDASAGGDAAELFLRFRREGGYVTSGHSPDGKKWTDFFPDAVEWGDTVKVGVYAKNLHDDPYEVVFDEYKLTVSKK